MILVGCGVLHVFNIANVSNSRNIILSKVITKTFIIHYIVVFLKYTKWKFWSLKFLASLFLADVDQQIKVVMTNKFERLERLTVGKIPRRSVLQLAVLSPLLLKSYDVAAAIMPDMQEPDVVRTLKFPSGVKIQEIVEGEGANAHEGDLVEINYVCRRSNGYFVHSTVDQFSGESAPVLLPLGDKQVIQGLNDVLIGMRVGGKRRALIPPSVGYVTEDLKPMPEEFGPRRSLLSHAKEQLIFEVQLLKIL